MASFLDSLFGSKEKKPTPMGPGLRVNEAQPITSTQIPRVETKSVAPDFGGSRRSVSQKLVLPESMPVDRFAPSPAAEQRPAPASSRGSTLNLNAPAPRVGKATTVYDDFPELQGFIDEKTLASGSVAKISEAILAAQRNEASQQYKPISNESSWFDRIMQPTAQAGRTIGDRLITGAQNIANYGLKPLGLVSRPITPYGRFQAGDRFLEQYAPELLATAKANRAIEGELSGPQAAAGFATDIGATVVGSLGAINMFRSLPVAAKLKQSGEAGIFATHLIENTLANAVGSVPASLGEGRAKEFPKMMATNVGFLFPASSYKGLAVATMASYLGNIAMGQNAWDSAANSLLGLTGGAAQRKDILDDLYTYRRGAMTDAIKTLIRGSMDDSMPAVVKDAAIEEAAALRSFYEQTPHDLPGLYKLTLAAEKRVARLYKDAVKATTGEGERRLTFLSGGEAARQLPEGGTPPPEPQVPQEGVVKSPRGATAQEPQQQAQEVDALLNPPEQAAKIPVIGSNKPLHVDEARRLAKDLFVELESEYNPPFRSKADDAPEYLAAERNAGIARELVSNRATRTILEAATGKQGYNALELVELDNLGPLITKLRTRTNPGSPADQALADMLARVQGDANGEYGRAVLNEVIAKARGEATGPRSRPTEDEVVAMIQRAVDDGRLQLYDDIGNGRSVRQVMDTLAGRSATPGAMDGYIRSKMAKKKAKRELLGDVLRKDEVAKMTKGQLSPEQVRDGRAEAALTGRDLSAINKADEDFSAALEENRKMTMAEFKRTVEEAKALPPEIANKIIADLERLKTSGKIATPLEARLQRNKFLTRLLTQQKGMTRAAQRDAVRAKKDATNERMKSLHKTIPRMPAAIQQRMKFLHENYRKSMPLDQQLDMLQQMQTLNEVGAQQNRLFKEQRESGDAKLAREVIKTAVKKTKPRTGRVRDNAGAFLRNDSPPNLVISEMGEGAMRVFKDSMDIGMNEAFDLQQRWDKSVLAKATELGITPKDMQEIVVYSLWNRGGKAGELAQKRLAGMGLVDPRDPPTLEGNKKAFYDWQQNFIATELAPRTKQVYERQNPQSELDTSDPAYFPMRVVADDMTVGKGPMGMTIDQVPAGFTKAIKGNESKEIYVEPDALFKHINDVAHYVALTDRMQQMRRILERPDVIAALGNENVDYLQNRWLDLIARHGNYAEQTHRLMAMLNGMGQRMYTGVLAGKAIVGLKQFGSVIDALGVLTKNFGVGPAATYFGKVVKNLPALGDEHLTKLGEYIETNPDLQASVGINDLVMEQLKGGEFSTRRTFVDRHPNLKRMLFAMIRQPDLLGRATLAMHTEGLYRAQGIAQPEAQRLAMRITNNVFGSPRVHNRPVASGHANTRPLYLLGQTMRARQAMFRKAIKDLPKDPLGNSAILGAYTLSTLILGYLSTLTISDDDTREKAQKQSILLGILLSVLENTIPVVGPMASRTIQTGEPGQAIPYLGALMNAVDGATGAFTAKNTDTKIKNAYKALENTAGAAGFPLPAVRSNYNLITNAYEDLLEGRVEDVRALFDDEKKPSGFKSVPGFKAGSFKSTGAGGEFKKGR